MRIGKLLAAIVGAVVLLAGAGMTTAGAIALGAADGDGWVSAPRTRLSTDTAALVGADIDVDLGEAIDERTFVSFDDIPTRIEIDSRNGKEVFVGIGPEPEVDAYLATGPHTIVEFWDDVAVTHRDGGGALAPPAEQTFWVASSADGDLDWDLRSGQWSIVVLNADGSPGIDVAVDASANIPFIEALGIGLLVFGVIAIAGGATMLYFGVRTDPRRGAPGATQPPPQPVIPEEPVEPSEPVSTT